MTTVCSVRKQNALRAYGTLNPCPERVHARLFHVNPFFDAHDLVQVKYEMLRAVMKEDICVQTAARMFGFSRPTWYLAESSHALSGIPGLLPRRAKKS
jgi:hypothetical protein